MVYMQRQKLAAAVAVLSRRATGRPLSIVHRSLISTTPSAAAATSETSLSEIERIYHLQRSHEYEVARSTADERAAKLQKLHDVVLARRSDIQQALYRDKGNHPCEVDLTEIFAVTHEIKHVKRHLRKWMKRQRVWTPLALLGSSSWIHPEPKGVTLIMSPWNFPFTLTLGPLISAVAAGNTAMVKPSEMSAHSSAMLREIVEEVFDEKEVAVVEGAIETSTNLLAQPFNHIFFTGAPALGKVVMEAAAKHLASVTLELGGKSPVIIDDTADIDTAAKRLAWAKTINSGQICIAPDYVYVHESKKDEFVEKYSSYIYKFFGDDVEGSQYYSRIINRRHHKRLGDVFEDAVRSGGTLAYGKGDHDKESNNLYLEPALLTNASKDSKIMKDEIFGPLLPIVTFKSLEEPITFINANEKPLAMYVSTTVLFLRLKLRNLPPHR